MYLQKKVNIANRNSFQLRNMVSRKIIKASVKKQVYLLYIAFDYHYLQLY